METVRQEVEREVSALLRLVFQERHKTGKVDPEAVEMAMRAAVHKAGAAALSHLRVTILPLRTSAICLAPVAGRHITVRCVHGAC